ADIPSSSGKGRRRRASAVPGSSDPSVSEGEVGEGREAASARVRPGTAGRALPEKKASGTRATVRAKENRGGSRVEAKPAARDRTDATGRPQGIARPARPDDLKLIAGVGPKIESTLNELGIYTYAQVAAWKKAERQWVDDHLNFRGRIERDDWVKQAKALAKGGEAEY